MGKMFDRQGLILDQNEYRSHYTVRGLIEWKDIVGFDTYQVGPQNYCIHENPEKYIKVRRIPSKGTENESEHDWISTKH